MIAYHNSHVMRHTAYANATTIAAFSRNGSRSRNVGLDFRVMDPFPNKWSSQTSNRSGCSWNSSAHSPGIFIMPMPVVYQN